MSIDEGRQAFEAESTELLEDMESALLRLEADPTDKEALNSVFRAAHTIKGSAGVVGLDGVLEFTHAVESVLEKVRQGEIEASGNLVGLMLHCRDHMAKLVAESLGNQPPQHYTAAEEEELLSRLNELLGGDAVAPKASAACALPYIDEQAGPRVESDNWHISLRFGLDVLRNGMDPLSFISYLTRVGELLCITTLTDDIPPAEQMDPESCYLGFEIDLRSDSDKQTIEDVFEFVREDCRIRVIPPRGSIESYIELINDMPDGQARLGEILVKGGALTEEELKEALKLQRQQGKPLGEIMLQEEFVPRAALEAALHKQQSADPKGREAKTIRVDTQKLDLLLNLVGELVIAGESIKQHGMRIKDRSLQQAISVLARLVDDIRDRAMGVRMMPVHDTFTRFTRTVRDICHDMGKEIELDIRGGDTELDKNVLEKIKDPLMHLIRNAADHGIELPHEREAQGKSRHGTIVLAAYQDTGSVVIEITDNGKGIDRQRLMEKAREKGLLQPDEALSDQEALHLIFAPGLSTADAVTNISGRGVGMDVVRSNIERLKGTVDLYSEPGQGTKVTVRLPLTLAIIDGFLVRVAGSAYVVPMDMVVECLELTDRHIKEAHGRHHVKLRGHILPYVRVRELFGHPPRKEGQREHILVVSFAGQRVGLVVDSLFGEIQTVIKNLGRVYENVDWISGATILGDGTVGLILDVPRIVALSLTKESSA